VRQGIERPVYVDFVSDPDVIPPIRPQDDLEGAGGRDAWGRAQPPGAIDSIDLDVRPRPHFFGPGFEGCDDVVKVFPKGIIVGHGYPLATEATMDYRTRRHFVRTITYRAVKNGERCMATISSRAFCRPGSPAAHRPHVAGSAARYSGRSTQACFRQRCAA